jgi:cysteine synthase A
MGGAWLFFIHQRERRRRRAAARALPPGALGLIGNTPLVHLRSLSEATGCTILAKAEFLNPGGSSKDRVALAIVREAEASGALQPGGTLVEATAGSTGVSLALVSRACGYKCLLVAADDVSKEKLRLIRALGADLEVVKPASIANPEHPVNVARRRAAELGAGSVFCDQFDNLANVRAHERTTGEEVWSQTGGRIDAFVMSAGTGGTIAGVSRILKARKPSCRVLLVDPPGSALYHRVRHGVLYTSQQQERSARRHRYDTIMEGVGCDRITANFAEAHIDDAYKVDDSESVSMARHLLLHEGLFVGGSSAMNCVGAVRAARQMGPGHTIVTVLCDGGQRYLGTVHSGSSIGGGRGSTGGDQEEYQGDSRSTSAEAIAA